MNLSKQKIQALVAAHNNRVCVLRGGSRNFLKTINSFPENSDFSTHKFWTNPASPELVLCNFVHEGSGLYNSNNINAYLRAVNEHFRCPAVFMTMNEKASQESENIYYGNFAWNLYAYGFYTRILNRERCSNRFTYLGGFPRPDKCKVLEALYENSLLEDALWAFGDVFQSNNAENNINNPDLKGVLPKLLDLDIVAAKNTPAYRRTWNQIKPEFYLTRFSLVQETEMDVNSNRYTEKTYKCFYMGHPFIIAGNYKVLELLRRDGFKTFSPHINEQYDEIEDRDNRIQAIIKETKRLCSLDDDQWHDIVDRIEPVLQHNYNHTNRMNERYKRLFLDKLGSSEILDK